ncbi:hypothetical protein BCR33DRAFT_456112 [Rhizoclosmatium globosum]|uniref:Uncharacterized protein n=1 Tax=Rhizoclosmatium globosum TaxID=329046 RepID=A0A1Y2CWT0_9FUNG|nr:hypothetical protein BCR33DRAFT_456112 [Rhizoclosmatium globosum]|eukprot:ORY51479.1 hypothetical protein BCR33DRAFT_456112 [Rhizoclosmatium globosum]
MWNGDLTASERLLQRDSCRHMVHLSELRFIAQLCSGSEQEVNNVLKQVKQTETLCQRVLASSQELALGFESLQCESILGPNAFVRDGLYKLYKLDVECCYADTLLFKGCYQILMGREIKGTSTLRSSYKLYQKLQKELTTISYTSFKDIIPASEIAFLESQKRELDHCISFGLAIFLILPEIVPSALSSILRAIGFSPNKTMALEMLTKLIHLDAIRASLAQFVVIVDCASLLAPVGVLRMRKWADDVTTVGLNEVFTSDGALSREIKEPLQRLGVGMQWCNDALERWPKSPVFNLLAYHLYRKLGLCHDAVVFLNKAAEAIPPSVVIYPTAIWFEKGLDHTFKCQWPEARHIFDTIWNLNISRRPSSTGESSPRILGSDSHLFDNDWFEVKPMAGLLLVACTRAIEGPSSKSGGPSFELAKVVRKEITLAIASRKIKKTRIIKFMTILLEWFIYRPGGIHPLLVHTILHLRRDPQRYCLNPTSRTNHQAALVNLIESIQTLSSKSCGLEDSTGRVLTLFLQGVYLKCWFLCARGLPGNIGLVDWDRIESLIRESFQTCIEFPLSGVGSPGNSTVMAGVCWIIAHAKFELTELDMLMEPGRWETAQNAFQGVVASLETGFIDVIHSEAHVSDTRTWGVGEDVDERSEDSHTIVVSRHSVKKRASSVSLGSVEVLKDGLISMRLDEVLQIIRSHTKIN